MRDSIDRIRRAVNDGVLKKTKLAEEAGVSIDVVDAARNEGWNPKAETVEALTGALDRIAQRLAA